MPTSYFDQFFVLDPGNPPPVGTALSTSYLEAIDQNNNGLLNRFSNDSVDGQDVTASWPGDTITVDMGGSTVTITGYTFYLADGRAVFTPSDGTVLSDATFVSSTYVSSQGSMPVGSLGPPCFVQGTTILTSIGSRKIQDLSAGDLVETVDGGLRPIRWIGRSTIAGDGDYAPVLFREGAIGNIHDLRVSPQHRVLINDWRAELFFGQDEVLVPAKHLVDGISVVREKTSSVEYFHLLFDQHELIFSDGAVTESFFPGDQILLQDRHVRSELMALMPELIQGDVAASQTARVSIKGREAQVLQVA
ncbi:MAG: Hint domain-containing protein [Marinosulfonomonas sp.]|nr:Hint domain-containing protein [Marinosulfonomonas sp.]